MRYGLAAACLAALLPLAGCGSKPRTGEAPSPLKMVVAEIKGRLDSKAPAGTADPEGLAQAALKSFPGPIILVQMDKTRALTVLGEYGRNAGVVTYASPIEQTLALRDGVLVATRGLGDDLMSADVGAVAGLIHGRRSGSATRINRYLDGQGRERPLSLSCTVSPADPADLAFAGKRFSTVEMTETCAGNGTSFVNRYWVTASGTIVQSRQLVSPRVGSATIRQVRE